MKHVVAHPLLFFSELFLGLAFIFQVQLASMEEKILLNIVWMTNRLFSDAHQVKASHQCRQFSEDYNHLRLPSTELQHLSIHSTST